MSRFPTVHFMLSVAAPAQFPPDEGAEVAFAGRSNAGKSSAINALTQRKALARTSKTPGQTRLLNYFELAPGQRIVDLPGYGYASAPPAERAKWAPLIDRLRARQSLRGLFLIVDARRGMAEEDEGLMAWAGPAERRVHVLLTKADKLTRNEARAVLVAAERQLAGRATAQLLSAHSGAGVPEAQRALLAML
ncbi:MAG TPA: ribosome biogenesis GTP-binding protein YihA/YsxC [Steroidobacteraceae bacterium]|nr:YihA family ribosome biogenesis GTP-binding protein [Steroidobacteraceae bacterium]HQW08731.1 ribosome biogenesis GTP-binding protein YihA/YsxC [Steroidobacteraceae bacterium]HQX46532.1 ribosome biogenesis GTP-binding protein YihA/YsxC [Steroidobacteraceae bacterium]HQX77854.1 ribosome biogenesis GTP-binding protein YihA/YsxC [Steroidobacteraceae bacterium]HQZ81161.1 ribosome biogenesis GTP-binding protein YihA/YsxC [Steroidobacteraceae bacterium]